MNELSWKKPLKDEFDKPYYIELISFIEKEYKSHTIFPPQQDLYRAFELTPFDKVKVIILGQDPYHGVDQANGLSFAVHEHISLPPSLKNIFKEIESDLHISPLKNGDLTRWATQGVLLLNSTLTVQENTPGSHQKKGWETFTDTIIRKLSQNREHLVFILWGNYAKQKRSLIDARKHCIIESAHPSPLSAHNGFFGSKPFSKANAYLREHGIDQIDWK